MSCATCNQVIPHESDTWCIGCAAWETLGQELTCPWPSKALRVLAGDQVVSCVKAVRALRNYSISCLSADTSRAALTINKAKLESSGSVPRSSGVRSSEVVPRSGLAELVVTSCNPGSDLQILNFWLVWLFQIGIWVCAFQIWNRGSPCAIKFGVPFTTRWVLFIIQYHKSSTVKISWPQGFVHHTVSQ